MDLRTTQQPLKDAYRLDPEKAQITLTAKGSDSDDGPISCSIDIGRMVYEAQAHPGVGGPGTGACSGDLLLGALVACAQLTCQMVAANMGLDVAISVTAEGDLDLRGTLGTPDVPVGFEAIRLNFTIDGEVDAERLEKLQARAERYCVVLQTLLTPPPVTASWTTG